MADKFRRAKWPSHVRIYQRQMRSIAWLHLSGSGVKVLLELASLERGSNNGELFLSDRQASERTGLSRNTCWRALRELVDKGFIYCSVPGGFSRKTPHAASYGLTWEPGPKGSPHRAPSHAYEKWRPDGNTRSQYLSETGPISDQGMETPPRAGPKSKPGEAEKRLVSVKGSMSNIGPQTVSHPIGRLGADPRKRKHSQPDQETPFGQIRARLIAHLDQSPPGTQSRLAAKLNIPAGTMSKFIHGRGLPERHAAALAEALP